MAISMTVDEATTLFISIARDRGVDPALINRDTIAAAFTQVFERRAAEAKPDPTPEQIAAAVGPDLDDMIRRGLF